MTLQSTSRISVVILGIVMTSFGLYHFLHPQNLLVYVPSYMPGGIMWVYFVGAAFILAAVSFITHKRVQLAGTMLAVLLLVLVVTIHIPNYLNAGDSDMRQMAFVSILKDTALAAFAMYIASNAPNLDK